MDKPPSISELQTRLRLDSFLTSLKSSAFALRKTLLEKSLKEFIRAFWPVIEPDTPLLWSWADDAVCAHLEAVARRQIKNLIISVPPRSGKSTKSAVLWPAWVWTWKPAAKFLSASYSGELAIRDSLRSRRVIQSGKYRLYWGDRVSLDSGQNLKSRYENTRTGHRYAFAVGTGTGEGGDFTLVDDAHNVVEAESDVERQNVLNWWWHAWYNRVNHVALGGRVVIGQRVHEDDLIGQLKGQKDWEELTIREEYDPKRSRVTSLGWADPRTEDGELLRPHMGFTREEVDKLRRSIGEYQYSCQYDQDPVPRGGGKFQEAWLRRAVVDEAPLEDAVLLRYWDRAGTEGGGAYTAGPLLARNGDGVYYVLDVVRGQWSSGRRNKVIRDVAESDHSKYNHVIYVIEQEPGSAGKESYEFIAKQLEGYTVHPDTPSKSKEVRADPLSSQFEIGNVRILKAAWNEDFIRELRSFPWGKYKDQVDAVSGGFNWLATHDELGAPITEIVTAPDTALADIPADVWGEPHAGAEEIGLGYSLTDLYEENWDNEY